MKRLRIVPFVLWACPGVPITNDDSYNQTVGSDNIVRHLVTARRRGFVHGFGVSLSDVPQRDITSHDGPRVGRA